ncbi:motility associated factor glycosyltransferase family protein [Virgibacillus sp. MG-45]|uniref:motility associated factor glycosyltransferase family protein n=1 Tax=Virgibacillus sp. MG-45 TaxID=3102791 RepID=UPI002ED870BF
MTIIDTKTVPTIKVEHTDASSPLIFHSKYNPLREADAWVENARKHLNKDKEVTVVGTGAGYHILKLADAIPNLPIRVLEFNETYFTWFQKSEFMPPIKDKANVEHICFPTLSKEQQEGLFTNISTRNLLIHKSGLDIIPTRFATIRTMLEDIQFQNNSLHNQLKRLEENFKLNTKTTFKGIATFKNKYKGSPMILISAGPSLNKHMKRLKEIQQEDKFILGAVGTALKPLLAHGITPDFFCLIDANPQTTSQLNDVCLPNTPLFYLSTAYHETVALHQGPKYIMWQRGFLPAEEYAKNCDDPLIETGGSVATALLDLMVYFGAEQIALAGQDLAFTDGASHVQGAHLHRAIDTSSTLHETLDYYGEKMIPTARNLSIYRKWFEQYAKTHPNLALYNCTEGGAYINHWQHVSLQTFVENAIKK